MTEQTTELKHRLVVGHKRDGRRCYDREAKRELVEAALQPGVSVAKLALTHGLNANLLRSWITQHQRRSRPESPNRQPPSACGPFLPVATPPMQCAVGQAQEMQLSVTLANGLQADLRGLSQADVLALLPVLAALPCSASTPR